MATISATSKKKIQQIINVFETGSIAGRYDAVTLLKDGPVIKGERTYQVTYGRSQTTEFGMLKSLIDLYINNGGKFAADFKKYQSKIGKQPTLATDADFKNLLKKAGREDGIMKITQDEFFDSYYWTPALGWFNQFGFKLPLSMLVIYDSFIHSGSILNKLREKFAERPPVNGGDEKKWISQYVDARHNWLATHSNTILHNTVYRTQCFKNQIKANNWDLINEVVSNGVKVP